MIIAINASIGEGKDTFFDFFQKYSKVEFENKKFAEKIKQMIVLLTDCKREDLEKEEFKNSFLPEIWTKKDGSRYTYRESLQHIGTDLFRDQFHTDTWVNSLLSDYQQSKNKNFLITDLRFQNEFNKIKQFDNVVTIKVNRWMNVSDWLKSKYFNGLNITIDQLIDLGYSDEKISKNQLIQCLMYEQNILRLNNNELFKRITHPSEIDLYGEVFDYVIENDSTLDEFQLKVKTLVETIVK